MSRPEPKTKLTRSVSRHPESESWDAVSVSCFIILVLPGLKAGPYACWVNILPLNYTPIFIQLNFSHVVKASLKPTCYRG